MPGHPQEFDPRLTDPARGSEADELRISLLREVLQFGSARLRVTGTSMLPTLWPGDMVVVQRVTACELRGGDIVLLQREGRLFCHRLTAFVELEGRGFLQTRGDFLAAADPLVPVDDLLGRVAIPQGRATPWWLAPFVRSVARISQRPITWWVRRRSRQATAFSGA